MKLLHFLPIAFILLTMAACKDEPSATTDNKTAVYQPLMRSYTRTDTVRFTGDSSRIAVIGLLQPGAYEADSSKKVAVDVLYYVKGKQVSVHTDTFSTRDEEELSHYFEGTDTNGNSCERFFTVVFGYPACGYNQSNLTFLADKNNCYFVDKHMSFADGAWGGGLEFFDVCGPQSATLLTAAMVNRGSDTDTEDTITVSYSDSTVYRFDGKQWKSQLITEKEKVYRTYKERL